MNNDSKHARDRLLQVMIDVGLTSPTNKHSESLLGLIEELEWMLILKDIEELPNPPKEGT